MRLPVIPFLSTEETGNIIDWGIDVNLAFILASSEETRMKRKWKLFGGMERYQSIICVHWPFWAVRRGNSVLFTDGVRFSEIPDIDVMDYKNIMKTLNQEIGSPQDWNHLASELDRWRETFSRSTLDEELPFLPEDVVGNLVLGLSRANLLLEADISVINPLINYEDAHNIASEILEFIERLSAETQRIQNLQVAAVQRSNEWRDHITEILEEVQREWESRVSQAEDEYRRESSRIQNTLTNVRREISRLRDSVVGPLNQEINRARSQLRNLQHDRERISNSEYGYEVSRDLSQLDREIGQVRSLIYELERRRSGEEAQLNSRLAREEENARIAMANANRALESVRMEARSEIDKVGIPAQNLFRSANNFVRELDESVTRQVTRAQRALAQFIEIEDSRFVDRLRVDAFLMYVPFYLVEFQHDKNGIRRTHQVFPAYLRSPEKRVGMLSSILRAKRLGENVYNPLGQYLNSGMMNIFIGEKFSKTINQIQEECNLLQNDDFSKVVGSGTEIFAERALFTGKLAKRIAKLAIAIDKLKLYARSISE